jgi:hypothetical protein
MREVTRLLKWAVLLGVMANGISLAIREQLGPGIHVQQPFGQGLEPGEVVYCFQCALLFSVRRGPEFVPTLP